jgi:hypothetical protein
MIAELVQRISDLEARCERLEICVAEATQTAVALELQFERLRASAAAYLLNPSQKARAGLEAEINQTQKA